MQLKIVAILICLMITVVFFPEIVFANHDLGGGAFCTSVRALPGNHCVSGYSCQPSTAIAGEFRCQKDLFGKVDPPDAIKKLGVGNLGISKFLNNLITLIYILATVVLVFMFLWGSFEWLTSGGDKEAVARARGRIINALVGITLFAIAYAILRLLGIFTGFTFLQ